MDGIGQVVALDNDKGNFILFRRSNYASRLRRSFLCFLLPDDISMSQIANATSFRSVGRILQEKH